MAKVIIEATEEEESAMFGDIAFLKNGNISFKCGSPSQCSQCGRCGNPKDIRPD